MRNRFEVFSSDSLRSGRRPGLAAWPFAVPLSGSSPGWGRSVFCSVLQAMYVYVLGGLLHFHMPPTLEGKPHPVTYPWPWWLVLLVPTVGGLISGVMVFTWAPEAEGHGTDAMIRAFHQGGGMIRTRVPFIKSLASIITIGTGGSAGQEGPIAQIGSGFGSYLARILKLPAGERRVLMLAGAAAGIGAIFRAPLGGALFAGEVLYSSSAFESAALLPCLASSIVAYSTFALFITPKPIFSLPVLSFQGLRDLPLYVGLTLVCAALGWLYVRVFYGMRDHFFKPIASSQACSNLRSGGFLLGLLALAYPQVMTGGYGWVQWGAIGMPPELTLADELSYVPHMGMGLLLLLAILKIVATELHDQFRRQRWRFWAVDADRRHDRRVLRAAHGLASPVGSHQPGGVRARGHGRLFRRSFQDALDLDRDGQRDDRVVQLAGPLDACLRAEYGHLAALDDL